MLQSSSLEKLAGEVAHALRRAGRQLVTAESCTAGLVAAALGGVPGISEHFCGSVVVYQEATKTAWLAVSVESLARHGAVSAEVAMLMAAGALERTSHADLAVAVTGHLGPGAPSELDGIVYTAIQSRGQPVQVERHRLAESRWTEKRAVRIERQQQAAILVLNRLLSAIG